MPDRESTDIEIFGMQGIPAHVLAAHYGEGMTVSLLYYVPPMFYGSLGNAENCHEFRRALSL
jgi:hypothetical protein